MQLKYDAVIVTRNRPEALRLSIPLLLAQSRKPEKLVVVDSSDDPAPTANAVEQFRGSAEVQFELIRSSAGTSTQRNRGLARVTAEVVFFPDDDSLVLPGALEAMMRIYDLDEHGCVGGVCSAEAREAPQDILISANRSYRMGSSDVFKRNIGKLRLAIERRFVPDAFSVHAHQCYAGRRFPEWLERENAVLVEWMTGFRMSFRTELIRRCGFDEALGRYALFEDVDAGFSIMRTHLLLGARNAQIYHYKVPGVRGPGRLIGASQILNRAYVLAKHARPGSPAFRYLYRHCLYKVALYATRIDSRYGRDRVSGAWAAYHCIPALLRADPDKLEEVYMESMQKCLGGSSETYEK